MNKRKFNNAATYQFPTIPKRLFTSHLSGLSKLTQPYPTTLPFRITHLFKHSAWSKAQIRVWFEVIAEQMTNLLILLSSQLLDSGYWILDSGYLILVVNK